MNSASQNSIYLDFRTCILSIYRKTRKAKTKKQFFSDISKEAIRSYLKKLLHLKYALLSRFDLLVQFEILLGLECAYLRTKKEGNCSK